MNVVWLKRDLRVNDHAPLAKAAARGPTIVLYIYEPEVFQADDFDPAHLLFINQCLVEVDRALRQRGAWLTFRVGEATQVLANLHRDKPIQALWSHQETGNSITYARDLRVKEWCRTQGVRWFEKAQSGVIRRLKTRDGWARRWNERMKRMLIDAPKRILPEPAVEPESLRDHGALGLSASSRSASQLGGLSFGKQILDDFLHFRAVGYREGLSSPVTAFEACSRLSPYLAYGALSMKEVAQATWQRLEVLRSRREDGEQETKPWIASLNQFKARLHWRDHFTQKLEDEPGLEFHNLARAYDGLRENEFNREHFEIWCAGQTGYPMVDACMRALVRTGWINFRMRAMLVSFSSYHLWLHWREPALFLARTFLDYEPGIHYSQIQMQSGVTGINTIRIYSPIKQVKDHDPSGTFIRHWVPELKDVPEAFLPEPWTMPILVQQAAGCLIGKDYPAPIVDHKTAVKAARDKIWAVRKQVEAREDAVRIVERHGSRRRSGQRKVSRRK